MIRLYICKVCVEHDFKPAQLFSSTPYQLVTGCDGYRASMTYQTSNDIIKAKAWKIFQP